MSQTDQKHTTSPASSVKMLQAMVGIGVVCALMIVLTFEGTLPRIEKLKAAALEKAIYKVLPGATEKVTYHLEEGSLFSTEESDAEDVQSVYAGYDEQGHLVGIAVEASGMGFADVVHILYGYDPVEQKVIGFYVLESKETPGLGDKIEKDHDFLKNFESMDVSLLEDQSAVRNMVVTVKHGKKKNPWEVDGITGATISSRAIGNIIGTSTSYWVPLIYKNREAFIRKDEQEQSNGSE